MRNACSVLLLSVCCPPPNFFSHHRLAKWHTVVMLTYGLMDGLESPVARGADRGRVETGFSGHVWLSAPADMWVLNRWGESWEHVWLPPICSMPRRSPPPPLSVTFTLLAHLNNMEMINGQALWPCKLMYGRVWVRMCGEGWLDGCALLGRRSSPVSARYALCLISAVGVLWFHGLNECVGTVKYWVSFRYTLQWPSSQA